MDAIVLASGGMDSCTVAAYARSEYDTVQAVSFAYGAKHEAAELDAARAVCRALKIPYLGSVELPRIFLGSALTDGEVPTGRDLEGLSGFAPTYVPARNSVFLSLAAALAERHDAGAICFGAHREDHVGYPDTRPEYVAAMSRALSLGTVNGVKVDAPFVDLEKADIVAAALKLGAPLHLTHSCYQGRRPACGVCDTCRIRLDAFMKAGYVDPIPYAVAIDWAGRAPFPVPS